jgi:hypothetical protein
MPRVKPLITESEFMDMRAARMHNNTRNGTGIQRISFYKGLRTLNMKLQNTGETSLNLILLLFSSSGSMYFFYEKAVLSKIIF